MPVKVRCPNCEKVLNAPDKARGKAIRCPQCETPVKVPAGSAAAAPAARKKAAAVAEKDFLRGVDLTHEDHKARICPKCGADVPEDVDECPKCFVNLETGLVSAKARKKLARGIDTDLYYRGLAAEGWQWVAANPRLSIRTVTYLLVASLLFLFAAFMYLFVSKDPLKVFWGLIAFIAVMVGPGWLFYLDTVTIQATMNKKRMSLRKDDGRFDFFRCVALGINFFGWHLLTLFPLVFGIAGLVMMKNGSDLAGWSLIGGGYLLMLPVLAVGMIHMSMPVVLPAWNPLVLFKDFGKTIAPSLYWTLFAVLTMLPAWGLLGAIVGIYGTGVGEFVQALDENSKIAVAKDVAEELGATKNREPDEEAALKEAQALSQKAEQTLDWSKVTMPAILWFVACVPFGVAAVFNMRTNGLLGHYYHSDMSLVTMAKETTFVKKSVLNEEGREILVANRTEQALKVFLAVGGTILFYVVLNFVAYYATGYVLMPESMAAALGLK